MATTSFEPTVDLVRLATELQAAEQLSRHNNPARLYLDTLAPIGRRSAESQLRKVAASFGHQGDDAIDRMPWHLLRAEHLQALLNALRDAVVDGPRTRSCESPGPRTYSPATINLIRDLLRGVAGQAFDQRQLSAEEFERIKRIPRVRGSRLLAGRHLEGGELSALLGACDDGTILGVRDAAILALLYGAGLRRESVARLTVDNLDLEHAEVRFIGKGNKEHAVPLPFGTVQAITDWLDLRGDEPGPLFRQFTPGGKLIPGKGVSSQLIYRVVISRSGKGNIVRRCTPHDMRRTYITGILDKTGDLALAQELAGHSDPKTTKRYDRRGERAKRAAVDMLHVPYAPRFQPAKQLSLTTDEKNDPLGENDEG
jgi:integrase